MIKPRIRCPIRTELPVTIVPKNQILLHKSGDTMNGYQYVVIGMYISKGVTMGDRFCQTKPDCPYGIAANDSRRDAQGSPIRYEQAPAVEAAYANAGIFTIKPAADGTSPTALGGLQFPSHDSAIHWLSTLAGRQFTKHYQEVYIARVLG
jgi:hypothetical protein